MNMVDGKSCKICLLILKNAKVNNFEDYSNLIDSFAGFGYYFDKISYIAYDSSEEISRAIKDGKSNYENIVIYCPKEMEAALKEYISKLYLSQFNEIGILKTSDKHAFMFYYNGVNRLRVEDVKNVLDAKYKLKFGRMFVRAVGAPSKAVNKTLEEMSAVCPDLRFNISKKYGDCRMEILYSVKTSKMLVDEAHRILISGLNDYIYALEDITLAERLVQLLKLRRMKISVAESFTGGGVGKALVEVSGVSEVYNEGLNTYSNEAKMHRLGVRNLTLKQYGAVSEQTAYEMVQGLLNDGNCDVAVATTGIAGPKSDNTKKPVGLAYISVGTREDISVYKFNLKGGRSDISNTATNLALFLVYKTLK